MASAKLSDKQREIFEYIQSFTRERGFPPSVREIGEAVRPAFSVNGACASENA